MNTNDLVPEELKEKLRKYQWRPDNLLDLHALGIHYHDEDFLPVWIPPITYIAYVRAGLVPPVALPTYFPENQVEKTKEWLDFNHHKLTNGGVQYLGNELNLLPEEEFEKRKVRVLIYRLSDYVNVDGAFGHYLVNNFIQDFSDEIFIDYAFRPDDRDYPKLMEAGIPLLFGTTTKRPLQDYHLILCSHSFPQERLNIPFLMAKSGIPLYRWQRFDPNLPYRNKTPLHMLAGLGGFFAENLFADHPTKGVAQNGIFDFAGIGEGEMLDLKLFQHYANTVIDQRWTKEQYLDSINNKMIAGFYDPRKILWEYHDKTHTKVNSQGKQLSEPTLYPQGGPIKRVSLLDYENKTKHVIAGEGSTEWEQMEKSNMEHQLKIKPLQNPSDYAKPFQRKVIPIKVG